MAILHSRPLVSSTPVAGGIAPGSAACLSRKLRSRNSLAARSGCGALCSVKFRRYDAKLGSRMPAHVQKTASYRCILRLWRTQLVVFPANYTGAVVVQLGT